MLSRLLQSVLSLGVLLLVLCGCRGGDKGEAADTWRMMGGEVVDSAHFARYHHYWVGYNLQVTDSLALLTAPPLSDLPDYGALPDDTIRLSRRDQVVIARLLYTPADTVDSVWVKVARDQLTQGWVSERELLAHIVPQDPISKFIYHFSGRRSTIVLVLLGLALAGWLVQRIRRKPERIVHWRDIPSFYPTLLCLCVSGSAILYGSIQAFLPDMWVAYYFHPSLNPFRPDYPLIINLFIASVWCIAIAAVAVVDEMRRQPDLGDTLSYLTSLGAVCIVLYLVFTLTAPLYIAYPLLIAYWTFAIRQYWRHRPSHLICGVCHRPLPHKGVCPYCGAVNE